MVLACRYCRVSLAAEKGCTMCNGWRHHLISLDEIEEAPDHAPLSLVTQEVVAALREQVTFYRKRLREIPDSEFAGKRLVQTAGALSKILEAGRRQQADGLAAVAQMSFLERAELFLSWYVALAPAYRARVREEMGKHEAKVSKPLSGGHPELESGGE